MPGIFGIIDFSRAIGSGCNQEATSEFECMASAMHYESIYGHQRLIDAEAGVFVGWSGFEWKQQVDHLRHESGVEILSTGEPIRQFHVGASAVLHTYRNHAEKQFSELSGGFAAGIYDRKLARFQLVTDPYGLERIFLHWVDGRCYFSSEAKAILAAVPNTRAFDPDGVAEMLACGCTLGTRSLFRNIEVLPGGNYLTFENGRASRHEYFDRTTLERQESVAEDLFNEGLKKRLSGAVHDCLTRPPKVGISLTAGLDCRMIMASFADSIIPCYTFGSMYRDSFDVLRARRVAGVCGQSHQTLTLGPDFVRACGEVLQRSVYISDGYLGLSGAAELYLNQAARAIAPVRITGNWGGELLRGVRAFKWILPEDGFIRSELMQRLKARAPEFSASVAVHPISYALFTQMPFQGYGRYAIERSQVQVRSPFLADNVVNWAYRAPESARRSINSALAVIGENPELLRIPTDGGLLGSGPGLAKAYRRGYHRVVTKAEYMTSHGAPHWMAALSTFLPSGLLETRFLGRNKFQHFRYWMRREMSGMIRELLSDSKNSELSEYFDLRRVDDMLKDQITGRRNFLDEIDKVVTLLVAERTLFKQSQNGGNGFQ